MKATLADLADRNAFDLLRLVAALLVLASHAWVLTGRAEDEPVGRLTAHLVDGGGLGVAVFFVLSGFLIARSAQRHRPLDYLRRRALRLYPAFLAAVLAQTLVLGPALTSLPVRAYLSDPATWRALPLALVFGTPPGLPGLFAGNPLPDVVNGSLWTLRIEALCYLGLLVLAGVGLLRPGRILLPLAGAWALLAATEAARAGLLPPGWAALRVTSVVDCGLNFMMGAAAWLHGRDIVRSWRLAAVAALLLVVTAGTRLGPVALHLALPYLTLCLAAVRTWQPRRDISYGTYLYAFPIQQGFAAVVPGLGPWTLIALSAPVALVLGWVSRRLIEDPAARLR